jgi:GNAT superfamily N-acetyltransferase
MTVSIEKATAEDYLAIHHLNKVALGYDFDVEQTQRNVQALLNNPEHQIFVAKMNDVVVGIAHGESYQTLFYPLKVNVMALAVLPDYQRQGIGTALLQQLEIWAKSIGATAVRLHSGAQRTRAHEFYQDCGYTLTNTQAKLEKDLT